MATTSLLPKTISSTLNSNTLSLPSSAHTHYLKPTFLNPGLDNHSQCTKRPSVQLHAKKKNPWIWLDFFDYGDDPDMEYGSMYTDGKQEEDPTLPDNPEKGYGFLKFPQGYAVEVASLGLKIRGDVRRCCCIISGGVYENLLFFPAIQLIKDRYPGVQIDIVASARGKQTYELNKNVRWANVYDVDDDWPDPGEYTDMTGVLKGRYYDMALSTKVGGLGHAAFLFMTTARDRLSYVYPNVNAAGADLFLSESFTAESVNLSEGGYHMYQQMLEYLGRPFRGVPRQTVPPLKVAIAKKVREAVVEKYTKAGVEKGKFIVFHGIESDSKASMQSRGDTDSLLPLELWAKIAYSMNRGLKPLFVIPHEKERENVEEIVDEDANIIFITTPGQLAALINESAGVIATNTAAIQLANAREKPSIAMFCSELKGRLFVPNAEEKKCTVISSETGMLKDIDIDAVIQAMDIFYVPVAIA